MSRKSKPQCPADRWEAEATAWKAAAMVLARICSEQVGCAYDGETHPCERDCVPCWARRALRESGKEGA